MTPDWRGPVTQLLYSLSFSNDIDDEIINFNGDSAVQYSTLELGPEVYHHAIESALASGEPLDDMALLPQFQQVQIAAFLRGVSARLDELRPWQYPEFRRVDVDDVDAHFEHAVKIARLDASLVEVTDLLQKGFRPFGASRPGMQVLTLSLRTGETVTLSGSYGLDERVFLSTDGSNDPAETMAHFISATGFPSDKVARL